MEEKKYEKVIKKAAQAAENGNVEEAFNLYKKAIDIEPKRVDTYYNIALLYHQQGQLDEAIANFEKAAELDPNDASVFNNLGVLYYSKEMLEEAESNFKKAIAIKPDYIDALYGLGKIYRKYPKKGKKQESKQYVNEIKKIIQILYKQGKKEKAGRLSQKLKKLEDKNLSWLHLGCGNQYFYGYVNIDRRKTIATDLVCDIRKLPYPNNSAELIETYHVIEHLPRHDLPKALREWYRTLRPGGKLIIECPDFDTSVREYLRDNNPETQLHYIYGRQRFPGDVHYFGYNFERLKRILSECGYTAIEKKAPQDYHAKEAPCLRVECRSKKESREKKLEKAIFIGGVGRSGTTLLQKLLDTHKNISAFGETKVVAQPINFLHNFIDSSRDERKKVLPKFKRLWLKDFYRFRVSWRVSQDDDGWRGLYEWFTKTEIQDCLSILDKLRKAQTKERIHRIYGRFITTLFSKYANKQEKRYWAEKTPANSVYAPFLAKCFDNLKLINVIRDGRDVACSLLKVPWGPDEPKKALDWWAFYLTKALKAQKKLPQNSFLNVRYEDLVLKTEPTLHRIIDFLGVDWDDNLLSFEIYKSSVRRYKKDLDHEAQQYAKDKYGALLSRFGYSELS